MSEISLTYRNGMVVAQSTGDDDDESGPGRILTVEEFIERLRDRTDIFGIDRNHRFRNTEIVTLLIAIVVGVLATNAAKTAIKVTTDYYQKSSSNAVTTVTLLPPMDNPFVTKPVMREKPVVSNTDGRKGLRQNKPATSVRPTGGSGGGSVRSRVVKAGVLGYLSTHTRGRDVDGEFMSKGGFAEGIDAIISGVKGLKQGGMGSVNRRSAEGIGFGTGYGSGFGGTSAGGIDDLMRDLRSQESISLTPLKTGPPRIDMDADVKTLGGVSLTSTGRSKASILRVVMQNIAALRYAYNKRLREKPGLTGKITIKFAIDEFGSVVHCEVVESTMMDGELENAVAGKILRWRFDRIDKPGDITEVVYPFVFST